MKYLLMFLILCGFMGCRSIAIKSVINPLYEAKTNELAKREPIPTRKEIKQELKGIPRWLDKEKLEIKGVGKNEADFEAKKIKNDSGFKIPFGGTELRDLPRR